MLSNTYGEEGVEGFPGTRPLLQRGGAGTEVSVRERGDLGLQPVDERDGVVVPPPRCLPVVAAAAAEHAAQQSPQPSARCLAASPPLQPATAPAEELDVADATADTPGRRRVGKLEGCGAGGGGRRCRRHRAASSLLASAPPLRLWSSAVWHARRRVLWAIGSCGRG